LYPPRKSSCASCRHASGRSNKSNEHYQELLGRHAEDLRSLQNVLYASNSHALLVIFQAMDAAGKDGMIKHVMSGVNPQGCQVYSFSIRARRS